MNKTKVTYQISDLSPHLFWDVDINRHDWIKNKKFVIHRVLEYGLEKDWHIIKVQYDMNEIKQVALSSRSLDEVAMSYIALITDTPLEEFRCYKHKQLVPDFSGY